MAKTKLGGRNSVYDTPSRWAVHRKLSYMTPNQDSDTSSAFVKPFNLQRSSFLTMKDVKGTNLADGACCPDSSGPETLIRHDSLHAIISALPMSISKNIKGISVGSPLGYERSQ